MKKRVACILVILLMLFSSITVYAGDASYHNDKMRRILFSSGICINKTSQTEIKTTLLENASYLAIDQSGEKPGDQNKLSFLKFNGVKGIVKTIDEINPETPFLHRSYTHRGWNYQYINDKSNWSERKNILLQTVEKVFSFNRFYTTTEATKKREALCKYIYYIHIIGDLYYDDQDNIQNVTSSISNSLEKERGLIIAFAQAHPGQDNPDVFWELLDATKELFSAQSDSFKYQSFLGKLDALAKEARTLVGQTGGINTLERLRQKAGYEKELIELLEAYLPLLLDDTVFFRKAFPMQ